MTNKEHSGLAGNFRLVENEPVKQGLNGSEDKRASYGASSLVPPLIPLLSNGTSAAINAPLWPEILQ